MVVETYHDAALSREPCGGVLNHIPSGTLVFIDATQIEDAAKLAAERSSEFKYGESSKPSISRKSVPCGLPMCVCFSTARCTSVFQPCLRSWSAARNDPVECRVLEAHSAVRWYSILSIARRYRKAMDLTNRCSGVQSGRNSSRCWWNSCLGKGSTPRYTSVS